MYGREWMNLQDQYTSPAYEPWHKTEEAKQNPAPPIMPYGYGGAEPDPAAILKTAECIISGDRAEQHGDYHMNHANIASLWQGYLGTQITSRDVALMMVLLKVARTKEGEHNKDDYIDICGYAALAEGLDNGS